MSGKKCTRGKSCGSACVASSYTCVKDLPGSFEDKFAQMLARMDMSRERREKERERAWIAKKEAQVAEFFDPSYEDQPLSDLEQENREKYVLPEVDFMIQNGLELQDLSGTNPNWVEVLRNGERLGNGAYGVVYAKGELAVKVGRLTYEEVKMGVEASEMGLGPKILVAPSLNNRSPKDMFEGVMVMKRVRGTTFGNLDHNEQFDPEFVAQAYTSLYEKQKKMHEAGISHNDFHTGNIMIQNTGEAVIIDWAFAKKGEWGRVGREAVDSPVADYLDSLDESSVPKKLASYKEFLDSDDYFSAGSSDAKASALSPYRGDD
ncbi:APH-like putative serine/threonine kinase [Synechococcus phage S-CBWM1]|uniref:APH-like putative serine/threonine kinase n=1 Tax=Synechococcus phage S-CBWM1 TaxID=2053653 RepID=A0A3G1L3T7_9CAUD|nr:APH-like putative serine/threonine kinase [Synechococcus phage S-CBWM1]ATW62846.1 APH-like putative serine/threonine kinase [Synechococcus phage S-CBWM1]